MVHMPNPDKTSRSIPSTHVSTLSRDLLVCKEHALALLQLVLVGDAVLLSLTSLLLGGQSKLPQQGYGLPIPVEHQNVVLVHHWIVSAANGLPQTHAHAVIRCPNRWHCLTDCAPEHSVTFVLQPASPGLLPEQTHACLLSSIHHMYTTCVTYG